ncbi:hypothetical protein PMAYCL1PPCAC_23177 [Pristionchus mayeri]|uniref:Uncharacterized protein n=1 Tax=Pristionchus mayeri TaxID=1317129 RepID=A0AAN5CYR1_9BILA|nr:hypothetical protein PMAYCL1PPCAC_23177 [Pristionchus mayeri]
MKRRCTDGIFVYKDEVIIEYRLEGADPKSRPLKLRAPTHGFVLFKPATEVHDKLIDRTHLCTLYPSRDELPLLV